MAYSARFDEALSWASQLHRDQKRKGKDVPYVNHLLAVASLVGTHGGDEDQVIAALLHDAIEDCVGEVEDVADQIEEKFGARVLSIVEGCTDAYTDPKPAWKERKVEYIEHLRGSDDEDPVLLVALADKVHNARSIVRDLQQVGDALWERFNASRGQTIWYYETLAEVFDDKRSGALADELKSLVEKMKGSVRAEPDWREETSWTAGDRWSLSIPEEDSMALMVLPLWGMCEATWCYRVACEPADEETIDVMTYDVFRNVDGEVLVVSGYRGRDARSDGDFIEDRGVRVWVAPPRAAEPPAHLVDSGGRAQVEDWVFNGIAPVETRWNRTVEMGLASRLERAEVVEPNAVIHSVMRRVKRFLEDRTWSWKSRDVDVADTPRFAGRFIGDNCGGDPRWGLVYDAAASDEEFLVIVTVGTGSARGEEIDGRLAYGDEVDRAISEHGETEGLKRVVARRVYDRYGASLAGSVSF